MRLRLGKKVSVANQEDRAYVPSEDVIGYDFFANFTVVVDSVGRKMTFVRTKL